MNTAADFTAESMRREHETENRRKERRSRFLEIARGNWPKLAERIKQKALWHLHHADVEVREAEGLLGLAEFGKEHWNDLEWVVRELGEEYGFEMKYEWEAHPRRWRFQWAGTSLSEA